LPSMRATEERRTIAFFVDGGSRVAQVLGLENSQLVQSKTTQSLKIHIGISDCILNRCNCH
jgi:hypothetical protein